MKKYYIKTKEGLKELNVGDIVSKEKTLKTPYIKCTISKTLKVTEEDLEEFIKQGLVEVKEIKKEPSSTTTFNPETTKEQFKDNKNQQKPEFRYITNIDFYVQKLSNKLGWRIEKTWNYLNNLFKLYPAAVFSTLLKVIAVEFDKKYADHIRNAKTLYIVSNISGKIIASSNKDSIINYKNFAAFRSEKEAKLALDILKPLHEVMFNTEPNTK